MANPLVPQGSLNKLLASMSFLAFPQLNITPAFLGSQMLVFTYDGEATGFIPTATGVVTSPQPMQMCSIRAHLLRTQSLAALFDAQFKLNTVLGFSTVRPDSSTLPPFDVFNTSMEGVDQLQLNGSDAGYVVAMRGYVLRNAALWG